jgi:hypothetical protein
MLGLLPDFWKMEFKTYRSIGAKKQVPILFPVWALYIYREGDIGKTKNRNLSTVTLKGVSA